MNFFAGVDTGNEFTIDGDSPFAAGQSIGDVIVSTPGVDAPNNLGIEADNVADATPVGAVNAKVDRADVDLPSTLNAIRLRVLSRPGPRSHSRILANRRTFRRVRRLSLPGEESGDHFQP